MGVSSIGSPDFIGSLDRYAAFGDDRDELSSRARSLQNAVRSEGESIGVGEGCAHTLEEGNGIGINNTAYLSGMKGTGKQKQTK